MADPEWDDDELDGSDFDGSDFEDDDFDYDEFIANEFPDSSDRSLSRTHRPIWRWTAIALLICFVLAFLLVIR